MDKQLFEKLADLRVAERAIKDQIEEIYPEIIKSIEAEELEDGTIIESSKGKFTVSNRRTWTYTTETKAVEENLKKLKKEEEQKGLATYTTKPSVVFKELE